MESNWRFGVWNYGFSLANAIYVARLNVPVGIRTGIGYFTNGQLRLVTLALVPGQAPVVGNPATKVGTRFPFGHAVEPD